MQVPMLMLLIKNHYTFKWLCKTVTQRKTNLFQLERFMSYHLRDLLAAVRVDVTTWGFFEL